MNPNLKARNYALLALLVIVIIFFYGVGFLRIQGG